MKILFLNKGDVDEISGGYIYNRNILEYGRAKAFEIFYSSQLQQGYDLHVVDSLMFDQANLFSEDLLDKTIALVHQFPFSKLSYIEQHLTVGERNRLHYIVTGFKTKQDLIESWSISEDHIQVIYPGIENQWQIRKSHQQPSLNELIMVANYLPGKGYESLDKLVPLLYKFDLKLNCYGNSQLDSSYYQSVANRLKRLDSESRVRLRPTVSRLQINQAFLNSNICISLSKSETFGMAIAEAIYTGLKVLMYKTGEWQFFEQFDQTYVIDNQDFDAFEKRLQDVLNENQSEAKGSNHLKVLQTWEEVANQFYDYCSHKFVKS